MTVLEDISTMMSGLEELKTELDRKEKARKMSICRHVNGDTHSNAESRYPIVLTML